MKRPHMPDRLRFALRCAAAVLACALLPPAPARAEPPGIAPIDSGRVPVDEHQYPPEMRLDGFDGRYRELGLYAGVNAPRGRVAMWSARAGKLTTEAYPADEFVYVLEGELVTTDRNGTTRTFGPGDTFVIPKGWAGTWDMKRDFRKLFVNF